MTVAKEFAMPGTFRVLEEVAATKVIQSKSRVVNSFNGKLVNEDDGVEKLAIGVEPKFGKLSGTGDGYFPDVPTEEVDANGALQTEEDNDEPEEVSMTTAATVEARRVEEERKSMKLSKRKKHRKKLKSRPGTAEGQEKGGKKVGEKVEEEINSLEGKEEKDGSNLNVGLVPLPDRILQEAREAEDERKRLETAREARAKVLESSREQRNFFKKKRKHRNLAGLDVVVQDGESERVRKKRLKSAEKAEKWLQRQMSKRRKVNAFPSPRQNRGKVNPLTFFSSD